jgi:hypothetical protein
MPILVFLISLLPYALGLILLYYVIYHAVSNAINDQLDKPKLTKLLRRIDASRTELEKEAHD